MYLLLLAFAVDEDGLDREVRFAELVGLQDGVLSERLELVLTTVVEPLLPRLDLDGVGVYWGFELRCILDRVLELEDGWGH